MVSVWQWSIMPNGLCMKFKITEMKREIYQLVERDTNKVKRSGDYWSIVNDCIERGTNLYYTRLKPTKQ